MFGWFKKKKEKEVEIVEDVEVWAVRNTTKVPVHCVVTFIDPHSDLQDEGILRGSNRRLGITKTVLDGKKIRNRHAFMLIDEDDPEAVKRYYEDDVSKEIADNDIIVLSMDGDLLVPISRASVVHYKFVYGEIEVTEENVKINREHWFDCN